MQIPGSNDHELLLKQRNNNETNIIYDCDQDEYQI